MRANPGIYKAYILRIWRAERDGQPVTFISIEDGQNGQQNVFAGLPAFLEFLESGDCAVRQEIESSRSENDSGNAPDR